MILGGLSCHLEDEDGPEESMLDRGGNGDTDDNIRGLELGELIRSYPRRWVGRP